MLVNVVVVLGTEPVLIVKSEGGSCASGEGAWVMMAGIDGSGGGLVVGVVPLGQIVESTPNDTDCLVVVAGVRVGGSVAVGVEFESGTLAEPWWSVGGAAPGLCAKLPRWRSGVSRALLAGYEIAG